MSVKAGCVCGTPSKAGWYVFAVIAQGDVTTYVDGYYCGEHMPTEETVAPGFEVLEYSETELERD
ncbi:MAG: hypothetical protein ACRDSK_13730 [Actinophytocola sp.]|uniref:hypothetical protein n=1 Tax=Actinophytocola sp. TaxID=1872138 RepID=UPI003D6B5650